jgi:hypothetical protein
MKRSQVNERRDGFLDDAEAFQFALVYCATSLLESQAHVEV